MKILIDIGHPAHVHYFKILIRIMSEKGHQFLIIARDKEVSLELLNKYGIDFQNRGNGSSNIIGKFFYTFKADSLIYKLAKKFRPDMFLSFASPYAAQVSKLLNKPHITLTDTEHAKFGRMGFVPFSKIILTPSSFYGDFGSKHIRINGYMELCALHPKYFKPNNFILNKLNISEHDKYAVIRFISWNANHDIGRIGMNLKSKLRLISKLSEKFKVFISSEGILPAELKTYKLPSPPEFIHDILSFASIYIGEGGTTANECAILGTPNVLINPQAKFVGLHNELMNRYETQYYFNDLADAMPKITELIENPKSKDLFKENARKMISEKIDVTAFLVWFIENYPESANKLKTEPDFEKEFKFKYE